MRRLIVLLLTLATSAHARVVLLSIDAGSDVLLDHMLAQHALNGGAFERIARQGLVAASMTPAAISSTPVSHPTMFSGTWPGAHGVTGVGLPSNDISGDIRSGFTIPTSVDRLWTVAMRAGKRVVCIAAPGAEAISPETTCSETAPFSAISKDGAAHERFGVSPGQPNGQLATSGQISEAEYVAREERFADYLGNAVKTELARSDWDLLIVYVPLIDGLEHRYLLTDPRQAEYGDAARRKQFAEYVDGGYRRIDSIIASWIDASPETDFVIVSDHGMVPTHSVLLINNALANAGLRIGGADAEVRAISSGASAQVYVNSKRRFAHGVVEDKDVPVVIERVTRALRSLHIFRTLASGKELAALHIGHANAGDVYVSAEPGWGLTSRFDPAVPAIIPSTLSPDTRKRIARSAAEEAFMAKGGLNELSIGVHGHRPGDPRTQAIFYAIGPHVPHRKIGVVPMIDVAPTVLQLIGVPRPEWMTGRSVMPAP